MRYEVYAVACVAIVGLLGCGGKTDANEKNFSVAVSQYLEKKGDVCVSTEQTFPVAFAQFNIDLGGDRGFMALQAVGLLSVEKFDGHSVYRDNIVKRYSLTDAGKKYYKDDVPPPYSPQPVVTGKFCYGKKSLDKIVKWTHSDKDQVAEVIYLYKIDSVAEWAKNPGIQAAYPNIVTTINNIGKKEESVRLKLTNIGWES